MTPFGRNFLPGPTDVHPEVLAALDQPMFGHRSARMQGLLATAQPALQECFGTRQPVFVATSSATGLLEADDVPEEGERPLGGGREHLDVGEVGIHPQRGS